MSVCVIIAAMRITDDEAQYIKGLDSFVICADAGYKNALKFAIGVDLLVGDFDSLKSGVNKFDGEIMRFEPEKDDTDTLIAVKEALKRGYKTILIFGALGGRFDHSFANISVLSYIANNAAKGWLISSEAAITLIKDCATAISVKNSAKYKNLSVFAYGGVAKKVIIEGCKYNVKDIDLTPDFPIGVSNEIMEETAYIGTKKGQLVIMVTK